MVEIGQQAKQSEIKLLIQENRTPQDLIVDADGSVTKDQSGWGFTAKQGATTIHEDSATYTISTSSLTMEVETVTHVFRGLPQEVTFTSHMLSSSQIQSACCTKCKVEWEAQTGKCR